MRRFRLLRQILALGVTFVSGASAQTPFYFGNDLSYVNEMEDCGAVFRENDEIVDPYVVLAEHGSNLVSVRLWHDPYWQQQIEKTVEGLKPQYNDVEDVTETIRRSKEAGMAVMLGFHFSDFWADPGRQVIPRAWKDLAADDEALAEEVYKYVKEVLSGLDEQGLMPEIVKIGNETNAPGFMVHESLSVEGPVNGVFDIEGQGPSRNSNSRIAGLWNAGIRATREVGAAAEINPKIALHVADPDNLMWFYERMESIGVTDFDIMGFSYYYAWHGGTIAQVGEQVRALKKRFPSKEPMVIETGYLWDQENIDGLNNILNDADPAYLPIGKQTQYDYLVDLTQEMINAGATGVIFWESLWVSTPCRTPWGWGSSHEHVAYFDHRDNNNFHIGGTWPEADYDNIAEATAADLSYDFDQATQETKITFAANPGSEYQFERSSNLTDWTMIDFFKLDEVGNVSVSLPNPNPAPSFGRVWKLDSE